MPEIIFCRYGGGRHLSLGSGYDPFGLHHSSLVTPPTVVLLSMPDYCSLHPWSPTFVLYFCSWPTVDKREISMQVSISLLFGGCLLLHSDWLLSFLSHTICSLLNLGNRPLASLLNSSMGGLHSMGLTGTDFICNKNIYVSISFIAFSLFSLWI